MYDPSSVCDAFNMSLVEIGADSWQAVIDSTTGRTAMSVNAKQKIVNVPDNKQYSGLVVQKFDAHEIRTHVQRRIKGHKSGLRLLGLGLDGYETGEEGIATLKEQLLAGSINDFPRTERYLAIALAVGLDGRPRDFKETFAILRDYKLLKKMLKENKYLESDDSVNNSTWNICVRVFRGTDCKTPGVCFTKDIIYRNGNIAIWNFLRSASEEDIALMMDGKFDPSREEHLSLVRKVNEIKKDTL